MCTYVSYVVQNNYNHLKTAIYTTLLLALLVACQSSTGEQKSSSAAYGLSAEELSSLRSGDIIFRMGYGALSLSIVSVLSDTIKVSHCGIVARDSLGIAVIHTISPSISDADGMQQCTIEEFIADSRNLRADSHCFDGGGLACPRAEG